MQKFMNLSDTLQAKIKSRPTKTYLVDSSKEIQEQFEKTSKIWNIPNKAVPEQFDGRVTWKGLLGKVQNQGSCGSCWAFASTTMLAQRFNIQSRGLMNIMLSPTKLILCDWSGQDLILERTNQTEGDILDDNSCYGNSLVDACRYLYEIGTPTEKCIPYNSTLDSDFGKFKKLGEFDINSTAASQLPICTDITGSLGDMCLGNWIDNVTGTEHGIPQRFYRAYHFYSLYSPPTVFNTKLGSKIFGGEDQIRQEIWTWGPIATGMKIYPDFYNFNAKDDIYKWNKEGPQVGGHAVVILGWGEDKGIKYWIVMNSWGEEWGDKGFFRIIRGENECGIESNILCMTPDFFYPTNFNVRLSRSKSSPIDTVKHTSDNSLIIPISKEYSSSAREARNNISDNLQSNGGGIDPTTGYTRRVMITKPWVNFTRPVFLEDLPNWDTFIAGIDSSSQMRTKLKLDSNTQRSSKGSSTRSSTKIKNSYLIIFLALFIIILILLIILVSILLKNKQ